MINKAERRLSSITLISPRHLQLSHWLQDETTIVGAMGGVALSTDLYELTMMACGSQKLAPTQNGGDSVAVGSKK
jgi:hypothetical protein